MPSISRAFLVLGFGLMLGEAHATDSQQPPSGPGGQPPSPPPEAIAACKGKSAGTQASFTGRNGEQITGTCQQIGSVLALRPDHMPAGGPGKPPSQN